MSNTYLISDLHFGHNAVARWRTNTMRALTKPEDHDDWLLAQINDNLSKRDNLWVLGDVLWGKNAAHYLDAIKPRLLFTLGNHDEKLGTDYYRKKGKVMPGIVKKGYTQKDTKGMDELPERFWFTHAPIHPLELRGCVNVHGHTHREIMGAGYINVCVEHLNGTPIASDRLFELYQQQREANREQEQQAQLWRFGVTK